MVRREEDFWSDRNLVRACSCACVLQVVNSEIVVPWVVVPDVVESTSVDQPPGESHLIPPRNTLLHG